MATNKKYNVKYRRKRESKTDYVKRRKIISSGKMRLVIRKQLNNFIVQFVEFSAKGDKVLLSTNSQELKIFNWSFHGGNLSSAYLTGLLAGSKAKKKKINHAVLDIGLHHLVRGSSLYSVLKGVLDAGVEVPHSNTVLPKDERIKGKHILNYANKLKEESEDEYKKQFSGYIKNNTNIFNILQEFDRVKSKILGEIK